MILVVSKGMFCFFFNIFKLTIPNSYPRNQPGAGGGYSLSSGDLISDQFKKNPSEMVSKWNPFAADTSSFEIHVTEEDQMFGAEFDKIRQEGDKKMKVFITKYHFIFYHRYSIARTIRK